MELPEKPQEETQTTAPVADGSTLEPTTPDTKSNDDAQPQTQAEALQHDQPQVQPQAQTLNETIEVDDEEIIDEAEPVVKTRQELTAELKALAEKPAEEIATETLNRMKQQFYALHNADRRKQRDEFVEAGGDPNVFVATPDPEEEAFKELMARIRDKKAELRAQIEREQQDNLTKKKEIIDKIIQLSADADNVNRHYQEVKDLQAQFKEIGQVPQQAVAEIWKAYQDAVERFYDQFKINMELRDYDFKKNLAEKQLLIAEAKTLTEDEDVVSAFRRLQTLHDKWRLIGPVAKDIREELWMHFKDASTIINKRYQDFFEARKAKEAEAEAAKTALCEKVEAIDFTNVTGHAAWDDLTKAILDAQEEWKSIGFASRRINTLLFNRFRQTCDAFFSAKAEYFKKVKEQLADNLRRKTALAERAEALKDSTDWKAATDELVKLQKEWKEIGTVAKKHSDAIWKRFHDACDYFFEQKKQATGGKRDAEQANLKAKLALIESLKAITAEMPREEAIARLREVQAEWGTIGHVPFRDKDKVYDAYRAIGDKLYEMLDLRGTNRRMSTFNDNIEQMGSDSQRLYRERERLARALESRRSQLNTYRNNMGFFTSKTKTGEKMLRDLERSTERLQRDIAELEEKIKVIDSKLS